MTVIVRGGGDLATGVVCRLYRAGLKVLVTEVPEPLAVRRLVSFSEAVYRGEMDVEGVRAVLIQGLDEAPTAWQSGKIPVLVDPAGKSILTFHPQVIVDARMIKRSPDLGIEHAPLVVGLGPGFTAGVNCHCVIETKRGHSLGRVIWEGPPAADTGVPDLVNGRGAERVLRAPASGEFLAHAAIGDLVQEGQILADIGGQGIPAPFDGVLRGLLRPGVRVKTGLKVGDVDPRAIPEFCWMVSDKSLAIGGGVLEAILSKRDLRTSLWN